MDHPTSGSPEDETFNPSVVVKEEPVDIKDSSCSESVSETTDSNVKDEAAAARGEDHSDFTDFIDNNIHDTFSWAFESGNESTQDVGPWGPWRSSSDLPWQTDSNEASGPALLKPFESESGLGVSLHDISAQTLTPLDHFHMFVPKAVFRVACKETNNYAEFFQDNKRDIGREWWDWADTNWISVDDEDEMRKFLGICMVMSVKRLPNPQDYWSSNETLREKLVADTMSAERFSKLMQYFYLSNPWRDPERIANPERRVEACLREPLYKLSDVLWSHLQDACKTVYDPHQDVILRQLLITSKQHCLKKEESSDHVWKALTVEDASNGYIKNVEFHRVLGDNQSSGNSSVFPSEDKVANILCDIAGRDHCVFADSVFISPQTACKLSSAAFQVSANCSAWPSEISDESLSSLASGEHRSLLYKEAVATAWKSDSKIYRQLRTFNDDPTEKQCVTDDSEGKLSLLPGAVIQHNSVVKCHESRYLLSNAPLLTRMTKSDWKQIFWVIIDIALNNANVSWKESGNDPLSLSEFTLEVARGLINEGTSNKRKFPASPGIKPEVRIPQVLPSFHRVTPAILTRSAQMQITSPTSSTGSETTEQTDPFDNTIIFTSPTPVPANVLEHSLVKFPGRGRNCRQCTAEQLRTRSGRRRDTQFGCNICGINLCRSTCFIKFHNQHRLKINRLSITQIATLNFQPPAKRQRPMVGVDISASLPLISNDTANEDVNQ